MTILFAVIFSVLSALVRVGQFIPNFAPVGALALWSGIYLPRKYALLLPLLVMFATDFLIGFYDVRTMIVVYGSFAAIALIGILFKKQKSAGTVLAGSVLGSIVFFGVTNLAVWFWSGMYPHTVAGLILCYEMAIPFFHNTFISDLMFNGVFFGSYGLALSAPLLMNRLALRKSRM